jgi:hypothetical protein
MLCIYHLQVFDFRENTNEVRVQMTKIEIGIYMLVQG